MFRFNAGPVSKFFTGPAFEIRTGTVITINAEFHVCTVHAVSSNTMKECSTSIDETGYVA